MNADDERLAQVVRLLRNRNGLSQAALAVQANVPRVDIVDLEAGRCDGIGIGRVRRILDALGGRARVTTWFNGAAADRLLDERHAAIGELALAAIIRAGGWQPLTEVTFSEFGERGSFDLLAGHAATRVVLIGEVKSAIGSLEETNRVFDMKQRLAPKIALARFGWLPAAIARVLILPSDRTVRRIVERHSTTMGLAYPVRTIEFKRWLRKPVGPVSALWFVSGVAHRDAD